LYSRQIALEVLLVPDQACPLFNQTLAFGNRVSDGAGEEPVRASADA